MGAQMTEPELIEKMAEGAFGSDYGAMKAEALNYMGQPNGHSAWKEVEAMRAQMSAALAAIRESGCAVLMQGDVHEDSYRLGMAHLNNSVQSFKIHCDFGADATPDFALMHGINALKEVAETVRSKCDTPGYFEKPSAP